MRHALILIALLMPLTASPQTLGEAAARESARRKEQEAKKAKAQVYTNDDLDHGVKKPKDKTEPAQAPSESASDGSPTISQKDEGPWRARAAGVRAALKAAQDKVTSLDAQARQLLSDRLASTDTNQILRLQQEQKEVLDQIPAAKEAVEAAQKAVEEFETSARAAHVPPQWIEPPSP
jgi:hypothetical protein